MDWRHLVARILKRLGVKPNCSTNIAGGPTYGYGELDINGFWEYPLYNYKEK